MTSRFRFFAGALIGRWRDSMRDRGVLMALVLCLGCLGIGGCTTTTVSSRTQGVYRAADNEPNVLFVIAPLPAAKIDNTISGLLLAPAAFASRQASPAGVQSANNDLGELGPMVVAQVTKALNRGSVAISGKVVGWHEVPVTAADYAALFAERGRAAVLEIQPESAMTMCLNACFRFRLKTRLFDPATARVFWTASFDIPPKASRFSDFSGVAENFAAALVAQLRKDGVIK